MEITKAGLVVAIISFVIVICASGCSKLIKSTEQSDIQDGCIQPKYNFAFPYGNPDNLSKAKVDIYPLSPWIEASPLPDRSNVTVPVLTRKNQTGQNEIWFISDWWFDSFITSGPEKAEILIFNTHEKKWKEVDANIQGSSAFVFSVYELANGDVLADGYGKEGHLLAKYSEENSDFSKLEGSPYLPISKILFDSKRQIFWIFVNGVGIMSYDPKNNELRRMILLPDLYVSTLLSSSMTGIAPDGTIFILYGEEKSGTHITRYLPEKNSIEPIFLPDEFPDYYSTLFITNSGQVWLNDLGWRDSDSVWYQTIRSPIFIIDQNVESEEIYTWPVADPKYESSNGYLWFHSVNGTAWLDPKRGKWCLFTSFAAYVIEDQDHAVWMIADNKLYTLNLSK